MSNPGGIGSDSNTAVDDEDFPMGSIPVAQAGTTPANMTSGVHHPQQFAQFSVAQHAAAQAVAAAAAALAAAGGGRGHPHCLSRIGLGGDVGGAGGGGTMLAAAGTAGCVGPAAGGNAPGAPAPPARTADCLPGEKNKPIPSGATAPPPGIPAILDTTDYDKNWLLSACQKKMRRRAEAAGEKGIFRYGNGPEDVNKTISNIKKGDAVDQLKAQDAWRISNGLDPDS